MEPSVAFIRPRIRASTVVLPAPFGPVITRISFGSMSKDRLSTALKPSNETVSSTTASRKSASVMLGS
jgi:hypothetical protein